MIILVPAQVHDELVAVASLSVPEATLIHYAEDDSPVEHLDEAVGILRWVAGNRFSDLVEQGPNIRWLHTASAGVDHVLTPKVRAKEGLILSDSGPAFEIAISEFVMAWILSVARRLPQLAENQQSGKWEPVTQDELWDKTIGIIGLGPIGQGVAIRAKAFGMTTIGFRRHHAPVAFVDEIVTGDQGLQKLLEASDYVVLAAALTDTTRTLIGKSQLQVMKPSAWLINIARGPMVDEAALIEALQTGAITGACLDVFAKEPLARDSPLWTLPNVYIAPHNSSGQTAGLRERQKSLFLDNLKRFAHGVALDGVVDKSQGY